jgi:outer membrane protein OmpA-like peptidoglycan-associated protein
MWDPVAMLGNLSGFIPGVNLSALPTLPNIGLPSFPTQAAPAATPAPTAAPAPAVVPAPVASKSEVKPAAPVTAAVEAPKPEVKPAAAAAPAKAVEAPKPDVKPAAAPAKAVEAPKAEVKAAVAAPATAPAAAPAPNKVILAGDALFQSGKSGIRDLSKEGKAKLDEVVAKLKGMGEIEQIKVVGHADPTGKAAVNQKLSEARAKSIKSYLVAKGVKPNVVMSTGMGDTQAVVQCDKSLPKAKLKECHAPNRRVEIEIVAKTK